MALNDGRVISNFIVQAIQNEPITIYGDGSQTRSLCYVDDLVAGLIGMMNQDGCTGPLNLGNTDEISIMELAEEIIELTGSQSKIINKQLPADDPKQRQPDIALAKRKLNWEPTCSRRQGLIKTINYFKQRLDI